jgi:hypothetical protein
MRGSLLILILSVLVPSLLHGQAPASSTQAEPESKPLGKYSLLVTASEPSPATHLLNPPIMVELPSATPTAPGEISGNRTVSPQYAIESFGNPRYECIAAVAADHGCDAIDRGDLILRDANTVAWHLANHGGAVQLQLNLQVHDLSPVSRATIEGSWFAQEVIFVPVPKATPSFRFLSAVLVGDWNGNAIVFEPGKPLPVGAKKGLEDLGIHQDLGDSILYSYKVKDPKSQK